MAPLSTQVPTEPSGATHPAVSESHASAESVSTDSSGTQNTNAKIQEQVKVVINDLAKKIHGRLHFISCINVSRIIKIRTLEMHRSYSTRASLKEK